jgi:hypothetical protein
MTERIRLDAMRTSTTHLVHARTHLGWALGDLDPSALQSIHFSGGSTGLARYYGAGVAHASTWRCAQTGDERHDRLGMWSHVVGLEELGGLFLSRPADLADQYDALGLRIVQEHIQAVDEVGAVERIAANANTQRLTEADLGGLVHGLVCQRARTRHYAYNAWLVYVTGHDADFALTWRNDTRAVGTYESD